MSVYKITVLASLAVAVIGLTGLSTIVIAADPAESLSEFRTPADSGTMQRAAPDLKKILLEIQAGEAVMHQTLAEAAAGIRDEKNKGPHVADARTRVTVKDIAYSVAEESRPAKLYMPSKKDRFAKKGSLLPVILYYQAGFDPGAALSEAAPRALAAKTGALVIQPELRRTPSQLAYEDADAAYRWVGERARDWGGNPRKIALAGEGWGANIAVNVAMSARDAGRQIPVHLALVYPLASPSLTSRSHLRNENSRPLNKAMLETFVKEAGDPRLDLTGADLTGLPSATVITAGIDPLLSDGEMLADRLREQGGEVAYKTYDAMTHDFFGLGDLVADADAAQEFAADNLKNAFRSAPVPQKPRHKVPTEDQVVASR